MRTWHAELVVEERLVRRLIGQFPELEVETLRLFADGWDRAAWLVNEEWVFGFPRRAAAVPGIEREMQLLPRLAPLLPLPIPVPTFLGRPADGYPWPFFGSAFLAGREACDVELDDAARIRVGLELAAFLGQLHNAGVAEAVGAGDLPVDPNRRAEMPRRVEVARRYLSEVEHLGLWRPPTSLVQLLAQAERLPPPRRPVTVAHGDLHFRHLLLKGGEMSGVIDWVDLCCADPAVDLQLVWSFLPPRGRDAFMRTYGSVSEEQLLRARVLAFSLCAALACYGHEERMNTVEREAIAGLRRATID
jgi:aminoglycoside phosphotransferase (APT) family kinase protein